MTTLLTIAKDAYDQDWFNCCDHSCMDRAVNAVIEALAQEAERLADEGFTLQVQRSDTDDYTEVKGVPLWFNCEDAYYSGSVGDMVVTWLRSHLPPDGQEGIDPQTADGLS